MGNVISNSQIREVFYSTAIKVLKQSNIPFLIGGSYVVDLYTGTNRPKKDLDIFCRKIDSDKILKLFQDLGYVIERRYPLWLTKVYFDETNTIDFVDLITSNSNGLLPIEDDWFKLAKKKSIFNSEVLIIPIEETICQKLFVQTRKLYQGSDVNILIKNNGKDLNWKRILKRIDEHWQILLSQIILFDYVFPRDYSKIPAWLRKELAERYKYMSKMQKGLSLAPECRGEILAFKDDYANFRRHN